MALDVWQALLLGVLQGVTEWLPISSSGHLVLAQVLLGVEPPLFFDAFVHVATLLVVLVFFRKTILAILVAIAEIPRDRRAGTEWAPLLWGHPDRRLALLVLLGSVPTAIIGLLLLDVIESLYRSALAAGLGLLLSGTVLWLTRPSNRPRESREPTWKDALLLGTAQGLAILPGVSRSGLTIGTALARGIEKEQAARFSFLLAGPAIVGATILQADTAALASAMNDLPAYLVGGVAAAVVGYAALVFLVWIIRRSALHHFAWYCWGLGGVVTVAALSGWL